MSGVGAVVLAAGRSSRMAGGNKLAAGLAGKPVLRRTVEAVTASLARPIVVVTGHDADAIGNLIQDLPVSCCFNERFADGMATSLGAGIAALPGNVSGALIVLGDMPLISTGIIDELIAAFERAGEDAIVVPVHEGRRGHPVLWGRAHFCALMALEGDQGGKQVLEAHADKLVELEISDPGIFTDVDTDAALARLASGFDR